MLFYLSNVNGYSWGISRFTFQLWGLTQVDTYSWVWLYSSVRNLPMIIPKWILVTLSFLLILWVITESCPTGLLDYCSEYESLIWALFGFTFGSLPGPPSSWWSPYRTNKSYDLHIVTKSMHIRMALQLPIQVLSNEWSYRFMQIIIMPWILSCNIYQESVALREYTKIFLF